MATGSPRSKPFTPGPSASTQPAFSCQACKFRISKPGSVPCFAPCCTVLRSRWCQKVSGIRALYFGDEGRTGESRLVELRNMRVLLEEARVLARNLTYHRRARLEAVLQRALDEVD
jgi:hypothetical protein